MNFFNNLIYLILSRLNLLKRQIISGNYFLRKEKKNEFDFKVLNDLRNFGYCVIENYYEKEKCEKIIKIINDFMQNNPDKIYSGVLGSDKRIFGAEFVDKMIMDYHNLDFIKNIGSAYMRNKLKNFMTMANKTRYVKKNLGSGEGWHRDSISPQFKSILYLVDVDKNNGPFQIIKKSQKFLQILKDTKILKNRIWNTRFSEEEINILIKKNKERLLTFNYPAGTMLIVDTSCLHRGSTLTSGIRYALTNYYYPANQAHVYKNHFIPKLEKSYY
jgi:hypothetical protein